VGNPGESQRRLRPPQFGLRTLLLGMAACGLLFSLLKWLPPIAVAGIVMLAATIFCHVAGNAIGTQLRDLAAPPRSEEASPVRLPPARRVPRVPPTTLGERKSLGWSIVIATAAGALGGALGGSLWTLASSRGDVGPLNIAVGAVAFAVLGGLAAFGIAALAQVLLGAIWQALKPIPPAEPQLQHDP
jgi:hypothetical protein